VGPVYWTGEASHDPLFQGFRAAETAFHWHGETFDLPPGAEWLAWPGACRHQAFRAGSAYGLQFHLGVIPEQIAGWCLQDADAAGVRELQAPIAPPPTPLASPNWPPWSSGAGPRISL
jgi:GMP synthase-like glutamine amidotransferase